MKFEKYNEPVLSHLAWLRRVSKSIGLAVGVIGGALLIGIIGYHFLGGLPWLDAVLEASMILGGMGAVAPMKTDAVKLFASIYALFSNFIVLGITGIIFAPWLHRLLHQFHSPTE